MLKLGKLFYFDYSFQSGILDMKSLAILGHNPPHLEENEWENTALDHINIYKVVHISL